MNSKDVPLRQKQASIVLHILVLAYRKYKVLTSPNYEGVIRSQIRTAMLRRFPASEIFNVMTHYTDKQPDMVLTHTGWNVSTRLVEQILDKGDFDACYWESMSGLALVTEGGAA